MLSILHKEKFPAGDDEWKYPLEKLATREADDPSIALLDAWATAADVLAFYNERYANERFLRTATERRSVLELARSIGYELGPGVAAATYLAFTVDDSEGAPPEVTIPAGTQVQSIPAKDGELPQTFETGEEFVARVSWNKMRLRRKLRQDLVIKDSKLCLVDTGRFLEKDSGASQTSAGDQAALYPISDISPKEAGKFQSAEINEVYLSGTELDLKAGDLVLLVGRNDEAAATLMKTIDQVEIDRERGFTHIEFLKEDVADDDHVPVPELIFQGTPDFTLAAVVDPGLIFGAEQVQQQVLAQAWREADFQALLMVNRWDSQCTIQYADVQVQAFLVAPYVAVTYAAQAEDLLPPAEPGIYVFRQKAGFFGHNAPRWETLPKEDDTRGGTTDDPYKNSWDDGNARTIWTNSQGLPYEEGKVYLERNVEDVVEDSWTVIEGYEDRTKLSREVYRIANVWEESLVDYALSARAGGLRLAHTDGKGIDNVSGEPQFLVRRSTAHVQSERLGLAEWPLDVNPKKGDLELLLDGLVEFLLPEQNLLITGEPVGAAGVEAREIVTLADSTHVHGYTLLLFKNGIERTYVRSTVTVSANVVRATHGETVADEVLGSGDASIGNQRFMLRKPPLTYLSAPTPSGGESTLTVRVNRVKWMEEPSLYGLDGNAESYIIRIDNDANATVVFGDGKQAARLPTGQENVVATYRSGIGPDGEVAADRLTLLKKRPLGIREVTNPVPAKGAEGPEKLEDARENAPLTVMTLDRIVSLQDYEDYARAFNGIGKAQAAALWNGETYVVHVTIADNSGNAVDEDQELYESLRDSIGAYRDPLKEVLISSFEPRYFRTIARVGIDARYMRDEVFAEIRQTLVEAFSFDQRRFGQPVTAAEVVKVIHSVDGVEAVDLDFLWKVTDKKQTVDATLASVLYAQPASLNDGGTPLGAELLMGYEAGIELLEMTL
jgi:hypothetical protein